MEKPAITTTAIHPILKARWSPRSFDGGRIVEHDKEQRLFEAARWAPSSFNEQPWRFIVGRKGDPTWTNIVETMVAFNQEWARHAPLLIMTLGKKTYSKNGDTNSVYKYDLGASVAHMTFQAYHDGLVMHQMGGFSKEKAIAAFDLAADYDPVTILAVGYQGDPGKLNPEMEEMERAPRSRMPAEKLIFNNLAPNA